MAPKSQRTCIGKGLNLHAISWAILRESRIEFIGSWRLDLLEFHADLSRISMSRGLIYIERDDGHFISHIGLEVMAKVEVLSLKALMILSTWDRPGRIALMRSRTG